MSRNSAPWLLGRNADSAYCVDTEHPMWVRAKHMAREEPNELKRILRDEIGMERARWDVRIVQPVMPMAQLRKIRD